MHIRPLGTDELDLFVEATGFFNHRKEVEQYLESMFAAGSMRPEWCFVAEDEEDRPLGRLAFWTLPGMEQPFALVLLDADWKDDRAGVGSACSRTYCSGRVPWAPRRSNTSSTIRR
jgi:hypothetical protein